MTKMIVGLGNPGDRYDGTKHNMGFMALDLLAKEYQTDFKMEKNFYCRSRSNICKWRKSVSRETTDFYERIRSCCKASVNLF